MTLESKPDQTDTECLGEHERELCWRYLLGEMNAQQASGFEIQLAESAPLRDELTDQSSMLVGLSKTQLSTVVASSPEYASLPVRVLMTIAAIAACLLATFLFWPADQAPHQALAERDTESSLIAQAWADESLSIALTEIADLLGESESAESISGSDQNLTDDSSLSWMVAAVEAGALSDG